MSRRVDQIPEKMNSLGICIGASTISIVQLEMRRHEDTKDEAKAWERPHVAGYSLHPHEGDPKKVLLAALKDLDVGSFDRVAATGRALREVVNISSVSEPEAVEHAYRFVKPVHISCPAVVSAGGETFMAYALNRKGLISNVLTGNKCASGTGEFFLQQLRRMNVSLESAAQWAATEKAHNVSGRCSVFCKSDCTHATNKGVPKSEVTAGLSKMMAGKILELLKKVKPENIMIVGGASQNKMMVECLGREISGLIIPDEAPYFEALGAALWAMENKTQPFPTVSNLFRTDVASFDTLAPLVDFGKLVEFKTMVKGEIRSGDECILGLDVGSTTTKAVLFRNSDNAMLASVYLRTDGDPVGASRRCYHAISDRIKSKVPLSEISIMGMGVCGSGRQIAGLHAMTDGVINEIIAHAAAAVYFDDGVDTLFEIGGQDAKYTFITNGVPCDYAMNEACSAGTGSFLEESAFETLGVKMEDIAEIALKGERPPNFNDQCAAFISSDIKNAIHEGIEYENIIAGLVYSICMNYVNRVKGSRPVGEKVFMQGGVCYNRAVPLAMAALVGKPIIVPPEPGLMGAFGVALEIKKRIETGVMKKKRFDLEILMNREVKSDQSFTCKGGKDKCDRQCKIAMIEFDGKKHPFGGACNRYYNLRRNLTYDVEKLDFVRLRQHLIFEKYGGRHSKRNQKHPRGRVGINRSFFVNTYYPLYSNFFIELGFEPVIPNSPSREGIDRKSAPFCFPAELSHGFFYSLLQLKEPPEFIFLPHFKAEPAQKGYSSSQVCPFAQGEPFYLQTAFKEAIGKLKKKGMNILTPLLDLTKGLDAAEKPLIETAVQMGIAKKEAKAAFKKALIQQIQCVAEMKEIGKNALKSLETDPHKIGVVIFSRSYSGFVDEAHMGIPNKLASRGVLVMPLDFLQLNDEKRKPHMYWGAGQRMLGAGSIVKGHPQLFGTIITNFSCGPDSFIIGYFRDIMGRKPSLTLELDSHTADAGIDTRIEAFLDVVAAYRHLTTSKEIHRKNTSFISARTVMDNGTAMVITSSGKALPMTDPHVTLLLPSMGKLASESVAAIFRGAGYNAKPHLPPDETILKMGRGNTSCKECLPLILTTGTLLSYIHDVRKKDEVLVYFMPTGSGPCRFGQYYVFMQDLVKRLEIPDVALLALSSENAYAGMGDGLNRKGWWAIIVSDVMEDIRSMILANAKAPRAATQLFDDEWNKILHKLEEGSFSGLVDRLGRTAERFSRISLKRPAHKVPVVSLSGEIFVRRDALSRQFLTERLAEKGFAVTCSPIAEWMLYVDFLLENNLAEHKMSATERLGFVFKKRGMVQYEKQIKTTLFRSGLVHRGPLNIKHIIDNARPYITPNLTGEAVLTVGSALADVASSVCGVIAIGPFGCMPNRISEAILNDTMNREGKLATDPANKRLRVVLADMEDLPFLAIETDGSPLPQTINAKLETFCLRAERLHNKMQAPGEGYEVLATNIKRLQKSRV